MEANWLTFIFRKIYNLYKSNKATEVAKSKNRTEHSGQKSQILKENVEWWKKSKFLRDDDSTDDDVDDCDDQEKSRYDADSHQEVATSHAHLVVLKDITELGSSKGLIKLRFMTSLSDENKANAFSGGSSVCQ